MKKPKYSIADEKALMTEYWDEQVADNPLAFVMFTYPWGKPGTPLERWKEPRKWQIEELEEVTQVIADNKLRMDIGQLPVMDKSAIKSGRGPGKSTMASWMTDWMMTCHVGSTTIVSANTETQLKSRTWAELGKWRTLALNSHWFDWQALSLRPHNWFAEGVKDELKIDTGYYYAQAQLWSEENPDAFAGAHNPHGIMVIYDEASGIPGPIWTVTEGFFTEPTLYRFWHALSNPRRNTGEFYHVFNPTDTTKLNPWRLRQIDARIVENTDPQVYQSIIDKHGADSREARVEVYGEFPEQGDKQFISRGTISGAVSRELHPDPAAPLIMGVEVARFGDDNSVIRFRQGRDARSIPKQSFSGLDTMQLVAKCVDAIIKYNPDAINIDGGGVGGGVVDRLKELGYKINECQFGAKAPEDSDEWANMRTWLWAKMRTWLGEGCLSDDVILTNDLANPEYGFMGRTDRIMLEPKEKMKAPPRNLPSPDEGDSLGLTFFVVPAHRDLRASRLGCKENRVAIGVGEDVF